ncbi:MAG: ATP-binding protein [Planctomycetota bacterium]
MTSAPRHGAEELVLELPAVHASARAARGLVRHFAERHGLAGADLDALVLIADELMTNAVDHGGGGGALEEAELARPVSMRIAVALDGASWMVSVSDQGGGDPAVVDALLHPEGLPDLEDERGRGLYLMTLECDSVEVRRSDDLLGLCLVARRALRAR